MILTSHIPGRSVVDIAAPFSSQSLVFKQIFEGRPGATFSALNEACTFLAERGFSVGPTCVGSPQGVMFGNWHIAKWHNLTLQERADLHGIVTGDRRNGPISVSIFANAPALAMAALGTPQEADHIVTAWSSQR